MTTVEERFWSKVKIGGPDDCWEWQASLRKDGYGRFNINGVTLKSSRVAYELGIGPIPEGQGVLHTCDNPPCCNPRHLFPGTQRDNADDMVSKGRQTIGERHPNHKLTESQVIEIRQRWADEKPRPKQQQLADEYRVTSPHISYIVSGKKWRHI
jgi:hypothetical protein